MALIKLLGDEMPNSALRPILKSDPNNLILYSKVLKFFFSFWCDAMEQRALNNVNN
jgi:hypothetical protein